MIHFVIMFKFLVLLAALQLPAQAPAQVPDQTTKTAGAVPAASATSQDAAKTPALSPSADTKPEDAIPSHPQPRITIANPPPVTAVWSLQDRILWGACLCLVFLGYAGVLIALRTLKKIERQTQSNEILAQAALESASAARMNAQAILDADRPWILITVEPSPQAKNAFRIVATNRGRSPAEIIVTADRIGIVADENLLPESPEFTKEKTLAVPAVLLPGESTVVQPFSREDVKWVCKTEESLRRIELWQDSIFLYGRLIYRSLLVPHNSPSHQIDWCCKYIHGESASSLVIGGPPAYNKHINLSRSL